MTNIVVEVFEAVAGKTTEGAPWWCVAIKHVGPSGFRTNTDLFVDEATFAACPVGTRFKLVKE